MALGQASGWLITAERPDAYAPQPRDLICTVRAEAAGLTYDDLPVAQFPAHCDVVVDTDVPGQISVIAIRRGDAEARAGHPGRPAGGSDAAALDARYPWMVVLRLLVPPVG